MRLSRPTLPPSDIQSFNGELTPEMGMVGSTAAALSAPETAAHAPIL